MIFGLFLLLGGIGMFLYGIHIMSKGLEQISSGKLKQILESSTRNGFFAILIGVAVTVLIQSSGASSVMAISFVGTGMLDLSQALYIMLGANIGTTITAQIIAFDIDLIAPLILFLGVILCQFIKNDRVSRVGSVVLGFGLLFTGIYVMGDAVESLNLLPIINTFLEKYNNPVLALLFGTVFTAIIQSSSASVGMLQVLAMQATASTMNLSSLVFITIGMNIGACAPVILASFSGSRSSRRTALAGLTAKILGAGIFIVLFLIFPQIIGFIEQLAPGDLSRQIANFHLLFNIVSSFGLCPFVPLISKALMRFMPEHDPKNLQAHSASYINRDLLFAPAGIAVTWTWKETLRLYGLAVNNLKLSVDAFFHRSDEAVVQVLENEAIVDEVCDDIAQLLIPLSAKDLTSQESKQVSQMLQIITDIERISDHAENIVEYRDAVDSESLSFSEDAITELDDISSTTVSVLEASFSYLENGSLRDAERVYQYEDQVDRLQNKYISNHIERLKKIVCAPRCGIIFTDMVSDLERCADHAVRITQTMHGVGREATHKS